MKVHGDELHDRLLSRAVELASTLLSDALADSSVRHAGGHRDGQYALDLAVDGPVVDLLVDAGCGVLSEEAGEVELGRPHVVVLDPVDGSTNAALGLPWYATSLCVVDEEGPLHSLVVNHATGDRFEAARARGARRNGVEMAHVAGAAPIDPERAVIGINGRPPANPGWWQFRALGAAALDLCAVADGTLHGYIDLDRDAHGVWDYLGALLVCREVGIDVLDRHGRELVVLDHGARRSPVAAPSPAVFEMLSALSAR